MINEKKLIEEIEKTYPPMINGFGMEINTFTDKMVDIINSQPKIGEWIPCSERLPEDCSKEYLCCDNKRIYMLGFSDDLYRLDQYDFIQFKDKAQPGFYDYDSEWGFRHCNEVIAWMPLPASYKETD